MDESTSAWMQLRKEIRKWNVEDGRDPNDLGIVGARFSRKDLDEAQYLNIVARHQGYPMPDNDFGYLEATYELSGYCRACGMGKRQIAPFRLNGEPEWGRRHIFQLHWVFDEFFVLPEVWESTIEPLGVGCRPVVDHRTGQELQTVVQIDITDTAMSALKIAESQPTESCNRCGRRKITPITGGPFPAYTDETTKAMFKTQEYFGSGASAWNAVIVSSALFQSMENHKVKGAVFTPCVHL